MAAVCLQMLCSLVKTKLQVGLHWCIAFAEVHCCSLRPVYSRDKIGKYLNLDLKQLLAESSVAGAGNAWEESGAGMRWPGAV